MINLKERNARKLEIIVMAKNPIQDIQYFVDYAVEY